MSRPVLYLGDTSLESAAAYLAGLMQSWDWSFDYVPSDQPLSADSLAANPSLYVLSDYPAERINKDLQLRLIEGVRAGAGLVMLGGWESFHGCGGNWDGTPVASALPVVISDRDDRVNFDQPALVRQSATHPILRDLPWASRPPCVGGMNQLTPAANAEVILEVNSFRAIWRDEQCLFENAATYPLLAVGAYGNGRTAALATDVAPHWVGGLVDWGAGRVTGQAAGADAIEVGDGYARFFRQLLAWAAGWDD